MPTLWTLCLLALGAAQAEERAPILRVEGPLVYVPLGTEDGLRPGSSLVVYQTVEARDPRSGQTLSDQFPVGDGTVIWAGATLSRVLLAPAVALRVGPGDTVGLGAGAPAPVAPPAAVAAPRPAAPLPPAAAPVTAVAPVALGAEAEAFRAAFTAAAGQSRRDRIQIWTGWLDQWPRSPMADPVRDEVAALRRAPAAAPGQSPLPDGVTVAVETSAPARVPAHAAVPVVLSSPTPDRIASATLFYRRTGEESYRYTAFAPLGDAALGATIPAAAVLSPGMEWFVELRDDGDHVGPVGGTPLQPVQLGVRTVPEAPPIVNRSQARVFAEYVDFYAGSGADHYTHAEADFLYRLGVPVLYSMRLGAGTYRGMGGPTAELDALGLENAERASIPVGYNFGYTELEFQLAPWLGLIGRGLLGIDNAGMAGGAEGRLRLGREEGTSLDAGAARVGRIGTRYALSLAWRSVPRVPMAASIEVTDFPGVARADGSSIEDYGVRLIYDARYQLSDHLELGGRVGWALRNINHAGPSGGLQAVFSW